MNDYLEGLGLTRDEIWLFSNLLGKQEKSCGAVVTHNGKYLIEHMRAGHYSIPKGHVEKIDKDELDTARREILEETGLEATFVPGFVYAMNYAPKEGVAKRVVFFKATVESENVTVQPEEVQEVLFLDYEEALALLTHDSDKKLLIAAHNYHR